MVKILFVYFCIFSSIYANSNEIENKQIIQISKKSLLIDKIKTFIDNVKYIENENFISIIFSPSSNYFTKNRIDDVKVVKTLKENGLLNLFFDKPQELKLSFKTSSSPIFFIKILGDTLRNIGYYRYVTTESNFDNSEFIWNISMNAEYATDPMILQKELQKMDSKIINIKRVSAQSWEYTIDMQNAVLDIDTLQVDEEYELKRSLYASWLNVSKIQKLKIFSSIRNSWHPKISYYNSSLHLLEVIEKKDKINNIILNIPKQATYIKISDSYTLKNIKNNLILTASSLR